MKGKAILILLTGPTDRPTDRPTGQTDRPSPAQPSPAQGACGLGWLARPSAIGQSSDCSNPDTAEDGGPNKPEAAKKKGSGRRPNSNRSTRLAGWSTRDWPEANWPAGGLDWLAGRSQPNPWGLAGGVGVRRTFPGMQQPQHCRSWRLTLRRPQNSKAHSGGQTQIDQLDWLAGRLDWPEDNWSAGRLDWLAGWQTAPPQRSPTNPAPLIFFS